MAVNGAGFAVASIGGLAAVTELRQGDNAAVVMGWYTGRLALGYSVGRFLSRAAGDVMGLPGALTTLGLVPLLPATGFVVAVSRTPTAPDLDVDPDDASEAVAATRTTATQRSTTGATASDRSGSAP